MRLPRTAKWLVYMQDLQFSEDPYADEMTAYPERQGEINTPTVCFFHFQFILVIITSMQDLSWKLMTG